MSTARNMLASLGKGTPKAGVGSAAGKKDPSTMILNGALAIIIILLALVFIIAIASCVSAGALSPAVPVGRPSYLP